jgi:hypothetical protein
MKELFSVLYFKSQAGSWATPDKNKCQCGGRSHSGPQRTAIDVYRLYLEAHSRATEG